MNKEQSMISCIKKSLETFPNSAPTADWDSLIAAMRKHNKPIAGYRFFHCSDCENYWKEKSRDCKSPSDETCPKCGELSHPFNSEEHPEWPIDKSGNLL